MVFDKDAVRAELDSAAEELEKYGHADLAKKVDYYNDRLLTASTKEISKIARALQRIKVETLRRESKLDDRSEEEIRAAHAVKNARRVSDEKNKAELRRRLSRAAKRKKLSLHLAALRNKKS